MALDSKLSQTIQIRATGDQLLKPLEAFGKGINDAIKRVVELNKTMQVGSDEHLKAVEKEAKALQKMLGQAKTIQDLMNVPSKRKQSLFGGLDDVAMGKKTLSASKLKLELDKAKTSSEALEARLGQLYKKFNDLGARGVTVKQADLTKALKAEQALKDVRALEQQLNRLDARNKARGGLSNDGKAIRADITAAQNSLLSKVQNGRRVDWTKEIEGLRLLMERYRDLEKVEKKAADDAKKAADKRAKDVADAAKKAADAEEKEAKRAAKAVTDAEKKAADDTAREAKRKADAQVREAERAAKAEEASGLKRREAALAAANLSESQLRADVNRSASRFSFTPTQARGFNMPQVNSQIEGGIQKLKEFQLALSKAVAGGASQKHIDQLAKDFQHLKDEIAQATAQKKAFDNLPEQRMQRMNDTLFGGGNALQFGKRIAGAALISTGVFAAVNAFKDGAQFVVQFEDALKQLQAIAGATDTEMAQMSERIIDVSTATKYSATEITQAATQIAQAGFSVQETGTVLKDALMLATASGSSPAEAVETLTGALGAFQLTASESTHVVDTLVAGLNESKLTINQMQAALQYAGATAKESGMRFEELVAVASSLANAGIRNGSTIGTGLRQLIVDFQTPSEKLKKELKDVGLTLADVNLHTKGLAGVVKTLTDAGFSAEAAYEGLEVRAASAFLAFRNQIGTYDELSQSILQSGAAAEANSKAMESLSAKWQQMLNQLGALVTHISGPFMAALKGVVETLNVVFVAVDGLVSALGDLIPGIDGVSNAFTNAFVVGIAGFFVGGPWGAVIGALTAFIGTTDKASQQMDQLTAKANEANAKFDEQNQKVTSLEDEIKNLIDRHGALKDGSTELATETMTLSGKFEELSLHLDGTASSYDELMNAMLRYRGAALEQQRLAAEEAKQASKDQHQAFRGQLDGNARKGDVFNYQFHKAHPDAFAALDVRDHGLGGQNIVSAAIVRLKQEKDQTTAIKQLIAILEERRGLLQQMASAHQKYDNAERLIGLADVRQGPEGQSRYNATLKVREGVDQGLEANERKAGSGAAGIAETLKFARGKINSLRSQLSLLTDKNSPIGIDILASIRELEAEVARVTRAQRIDTDADAKANRGQRAVKDKPGRRLSVGQIAAEIQKRIPQAHINQTLRSVSEQAGYDRAAGIHRDPHDAPHVNGTALDMRPIPGMDPMEIVAIIEDMGLQVTGGPVHAAGIRYITPNHGTAPHWHFQWKAKTTQFERHASTEANKAAQELRQLLQTRSGAKVATTKKNVDTILASAKAGNIKPDEAWKQLRANSKEWGEAMLEDFDVDHPTEGLGKDGLAARTEARNQLKAQIAAQFAEWGEKLTGSLGDYAQSVFDAAMESIDNALAASEYTNAAPVRAAATEQAKLGNRTNRNNYGAGTQYILDRRSEDASATQDAADLASQTIAINAMREAMKKKAEQDATLVKDSPDWVAAQAAREAATKKLNDALHRQAELQGKINERTEALADIPLKDRLEGAAKAWLENSGAMQSWAAQAENAVGPTLDALTSGLTEMFSSIMDGSKSVKRALGDFLKSFATFVIQMIAKALALAAVKALMTAFGIDTSLLGKAYEGGPVSTKGSGSGATSQGYTGPASFNGGPVRVPGRFTGGYSHGDGGRIMRGFTTRDSALYNLAAGEYVVRGKSVREIGLGGMDMINKHGKAGLAKLGGRGGFMNIQAPKQETNVFVVQEKSAPPMGKNDVLVTIHEDIMQGGATKKLIKQVAQGG